MIHKYIFTLVMLFGVATFAQNQSGIVVQEIDDILMVDDDTDLLVDDVPEPSSSVVNEQAEPERVDIADVVDAVDTVNTVNTVDQVVPIDPAPVISPETHSPTGNEQVIDHDDDYVAPVGGSGGDTVIVTPPLVAPPVIQPEPHSPVVNEQVVPLAEPISDHPPLPISPPSPPPPPLPPPPLPEPETPKVSRWPLSSAYVFPAGYASYSTREGYREYDGVDGYEQIERDGMFIYGFSVGKRFAFRNHPRLRLQSLIEFGWGDGEDAVYQDAAVYGDGRSADVVECLNFWTIGAQADFQIIFPTTDRKRMLFLSAGPGLHMASFYHTWEAGAGRQQLMKTNELRTAAVSLNLGAGMEFLQSRQRAVAIGYNLRIWEPVRYNDIGDLFPMGAEYRELFFTHTLQVHILLPRSWSAGLSPARD